MTGWSSSSPLWRCINIFQFYDVVIIVIIVTWYYCITILKFASKDMQHIKILRLLSLYIDVFLSNCIQRRSSILWRCRNIFQFYNVVIMVIVMVVTWNYCINILQPYKNFSRRKHSCKVCYETYSHSFIFVRSILEATRI